MKKSGARLPSTESRIEPMMMRLFVPLTSSNLTGAICFMGALLAAGPIFGSSLADRAEAGEFAGLLSDAPHDQARAMLNVFFGRPDLKAGLAGLPDASRSCPSDHAEVTSGSDWVRESAGQARVLMFNENHYGLRERAFLRSILPDLREMGFTHLGLEAIEQAAVYQDGRYQPATDLYVREPLFAALLRTAESLGFEVFGYEVSPADLAGLSPGEQFERRETGQAENLWDKVRSAPDGARFLILAGWSHIAKEPLPGPDGPALWMAGRFREKSGIDPLVVDLTTCVDQLAEPGDWGGRVLLDDSGDVLVFGADAHAFDAQIRLPAAPESELDQKERAGFYRQSLGQAFFVPDLSGTEAESVLLIARPTSAPADAAAYDRVLVRQDENMPLHLPAGEYTIEVRAGDGSLLKSLEKGQADER